MDDAVIFDDFVTKYLAAIRFRLRSHGQIERRLNRFIGHFTGRPLASIRRKDVAEFIESRLTAGVSPASVNIEIANLSAAINYARERWEISLANPVAGLFFPPAPGRLRYLERYEAEALIVAASSLRCACLPAFITLALNTGCRKNEMLLMKWSSVDFDRGLITVQAETSKNGKRRYLPMNQRARAALNLLLKYRNENCPSCPWVFCKRNGDRVKFPERSFNKAVQLAGIEDFRVHDLRHTFASWLVTEGVELMKVRDLLGHSSIRMTERYAHLAPDRLREAVAVLDSLGGQGDLFRS